MTVTEPGESRRAAIRTCHLCEAACGLELTIHADEVVGVRGDALDVERLALTVDEVPADGELLLVGRRHLRSKNSWLHNVPQVVRGRDRCALWLHPADAARVGVTDGDATRVTSRVGTVVAEVRVTDEVMPGVCSLPHGWGNGGDGTRLAVASVHPGTTRTP